MNYEGTRYTKIDDRKYPKGRKGMKHNPCGWAQK